MSTTRDNTCAELVVCLFDVKAALYSDLEMNFILQTHQVVLVIKHGSIVQLLSVVC